MTTPHLRAARGLYDPSYEHDACGVAFVARLGAPASHEVVSRALWALEHLEHRGAEGADPDTGDGAGILIQLPDAFLRAEAGFELPPERALRRGRLLPAARRRGPGASAWSCSKSVSARRASGCSAGATCRWTPSTAAWPPAPWPRSSASSSWPPATGWRIATRSSASST